MTDVIKCRGGPQAARERQVADPWSRSLRGKATRDIQLLIQLNLVDVSNVIKIRSSLQMERQADTKVKTLAIYRVVDVSHISRVSAATSLTALCCVYSTQQFAGAISTPIADGPSSPV